VRVTALDFSLAMLHQGEKKIQGTPLASLICADGHHLPFLKNSFDAVFCAFGIRNLENRSLAALEIRRVMKPEGHLVVLEFFRPNSLLPNFFYRTYGKFLIPRLGGWLSKNRRAYEYLQNSIQGFLSVQEYRALLEKSGFKKITATALSGGIAHLVTAEA
jgi:ubiquinone/menaquinone biosynthesis methyltransferase